VHCIAGVADWHELPARGFLPPPADLTGAKLRAFIADKRKRYAGFFKQTGITAEQQRRSSCDDAGGCTGEPDRAARQPRPLSKDSS